jgi:hypothetical protein
MDFYFFLQVVCAVIVANAACAAFAFGAVAAIRLSKEGKKQDELPIRVYLCLLCPLLLGAAGSYLLL